MAGRFMDKKTLESEADRLGVVLDGLTWPQKQGAVMAAMKAEAGYVEDQEDEQEPITPAKAAEEWVHVHVPYDPMDDMRGKELLICPEMAATPTQLFGYDEELGEELIVEEVMHDRDAAYKAGKDMVTGTYKVLERTGRKVVAHTALPKEGSGIKFRPDKDLVPTTTFQGRTGYLWTHHSLPNIKQLLIESGYYEEYKTRFQDEPAIWHSAGKILACDINLVHSIFREIETKERNRRIQSAQQNAFISGQMGL